MLRILAVLLTVAALAGCSSKAGAPQAAAPTATPTPSSFTIQGVVKATPATFSDITGQAQSDACRDYKLESAQVIVKNESGTILATGSTGANARPKPTEPPADEQADVRQHGLIGASKQAVQDEYDFALAYDSCLVTFTATVPRANFYQMTIGTHAAPTYSFDQMVQMGWAVSLSLGR